MDPGYLDLPLSKYLADPCHEPSLSTGTVHTLINRTPLHARAEHPRLGGRGDELTSRGELGSAIHALVLGGQEIRYVGAVTKRSGKDAGVTFVAEDWKTQDAKDARDEIRTAGALPMLEHQRSAIEAAAGNAKLALAQLGAGRREVTMTWQTNDVWCRGRADFLDDAGQYDVDLKTCDNADGASWVRQCVQQGALDIQAGLRSLGHKALTDRPRTMLWLLQEIEEPYATSVVEVSPSLLALAEKKVRYAAAIWRRCLDSGNWPGYSGTYRAEVPSYAEQDFALRTGIAP